MRSFGVILHRWFGLFTATFLMISGLTGAVISWDHELDEWLNPKLFRAEATEPLKTSLELAAQFEQHNPQMQVTYLPLYVENGHTLSISTLPIVNPDTGKAYFADYNQVGLNPTSGEVQGKRMWGEISLSRENLLPFLYKLHYSMHIPDAWGIELGVLFMGIVAIVWVFDSFIALWLSFPKWSVWKKSLTFRWQRGGYPLVFDLHRSGGVWVWGLLLILAVTSVSMNLNFQVVRPIVSKLSILTPSPFELIAPKPIDEPASPVITREQLLTLAVNEAKKRGWTAPPGAIFYSPMIDVYGVGFFEEGRDHGDGGLGNPWLYFKGADGSPAGEQVPGEVTAGDIFMQAQFPLHSGRILGLPGRIMISVMGLIVAMLSLTGIVVWFRKRSRHYVVHKTNKQQEVHITPGH